MESQIQSLAESFGSDQFLLPGGCIVCEDDFRRMETRIQVTSYHPANRRAGEPPHHGFIAMHTECAQQFFENPNEYSYE